MLPIHIRRRTQVVKGEVCKTSMQRFESARRLHIVSDFVDDSQSATSSHKKNVPVLFQLRRQTALIASYSSCETTTLRAWVCSTEPLKGSSSLATACRLCSGTR